MRIVQEYRFSHRQGEGRERARMEAALAVERADPALSNPMGYATVLLEWMEQEHCDWFWQCCKSGHVL